MARRSVAGFRLTWLAFDVLFPLPDRPLPDLCKIPAALRATCSHTLPRRQPMDNQYLIPLLVTLVTAMTIGAIYLISLLFKDSDDE